MREHQIIINLKPEHYQELERLSRASGARSVSVFVKERMLISLGIGGSSGSSNLPGSLNVAAVTSDIRRLHRDLQVFVAESLSGKDFGYNAEQTSAMAPELSAPLTPGAELARAVADSGAQASQMQSSPNPSTTTSSPVNISSSTNIASSSALAAGSKPTAAAMPLKSGELTSAQHAGEVSQPAGRTEVSEDQVTLDQLAPLGGPKFSAAPAAPSNQAIPRQQANFSLRSRGSSGPFGASIGGGIPIRPLVSSVDPLTAQEAQPVPATSGPEGVIQQAPQNSFQRSTSGASPANADVPDDLEELAERAFAISPRLGAMEHFDDDTPMFSDPLDELLGEIEEEEVGNSQTPVSQNATASTADASVTDEGYEEGFDEEELEEAPKEPLEEPLEESLEEPLAESVEEPLVKLDEAQGELSPEHSVEVEPVADTDPNEIPDSEVNNAGGQAAGMWNDHHSQGQAIGFDEEEKSTKANEEVSADSLPTDSADGSQGEDNTNQSGTNTGVSQNPPPISGGPPPRRRRT